MNVFVYGTLKRGWPLGHLLAGQRFLGEARTEARFRMVALAGGRWPGLVDAADETRGTRIEGELWQVDSACLARLDEVEGTAEGEYERRSVPLLAPFCGTVAQAYFYLGSSEGLPDAGNCW